MLPAILAKVYLAWHAYTAQKHQGLVEAFDEVPRHVAGGEMAKFPMLEEAWLAVEDGMVVTLGRCLRFQALRIGRA